MPPARRAFTLVELLMGSVPVERLSRWGLTPSPVRKGSVPVWKDTKRGQTPAFTLVELMVVITIIVILLAMLTPAVERAKYQALLTICSTRLRGITMGVTQYAAGNKQYYPQRPDLFMADTIRSYNGSMDLRPLLRQYFSLDMMVDPLCDRIDLSPEANHPADEMVMSNTSLRFGWGYPGHERMNKLGDRWSWIDNTPSGGGLSRRFSVIAHDYDREARNSITLTTHPDSNGRLVVFVDTVSDLHKYILSRWQGSPLTRGGLDLNFAFADASVTRYDNVPVNDPGTASADDRMARVPNYGDGVGGWEAEWVNIPKP